MALNLRQKKQVNPGTRVRLINMDDPYTKLEPGLEGTVRKIDDIGTIHVNKPIATNPRDYMDHWVFDGAEIEVDLNEK